MKRQHLTRRIVLSAAVVGLAVLTALGGGDSVTATPIEAGGYGSKEAFKKDCELGGGAFVDSPQDGLTLCVYLNGDMKSCDQQGNNCLIFPKEWANPASDATVDATITEDTQTVVPVDAPLEAIVETPVEAPIESQVASAAETGTLAAPVEAPVALAEEPVAAEAPLVAEASAEQP